jgi:hypothetical protein
LELNRGQLKVVFFGRRRARGWAYSPGNFDAPRSKKTKQCCAKSGIWYLDGAKSVKVSRKLKYYSEISFIGILLRQQRFVPSIIALFVLRRTIYFGRRRLLL